MGKKVIILTKEQIELNPLNNWENGDMRDLIESLKSVELITPLSVIGPMENNTYRLISGERRYKSLCKIMEETGKNIDIPCFIVGTKNMSEHMQSVLIETANLEAREIDIQTLNEHRANIMEQLFALVESGELLERDIASKAAEAFKTSDKYARYWKRIFSTGIEPLKEMVKTGDLGVKNAAKIATFEPEIQKQAVSEIKQAKQENISTKENKSSATTLTDIIGNLSNNKETKEVEAPVNGMNETSDTPDFVTIEEDTTSLEFEKDNIAKAHNKDLKSCEDVKNSQKAPIENIFSGITGKAAFSVEDLDGIDPSDIDIDRLMEEDGFSSDNYSFDNYTEPVRTRDNAGYGDTDAYTEKLSMILSWCKEIMKKDELTDDEWRVIQACKEVGDCFM